MRAERLNKFIFWMSLLCFILQGVGYLSPAWFVGEVSLQQEGFVADGRKFHLPQNEGVQHSDRAGTMNITLHPTMAWNTKLLFTTNYTRTSWTKAPRPITKPGKPDEMTTVRYTGKTKRPTLTDGLVKENSTTIRRLFINTTNQPDPVPVSEGARQKRDAVTATSAKKEGREKEDAKTESSNTESEGTSSGDDGPNKEGLSSKPITGDRPVGSERENNDKGVESVTAAKDPHGEVVKDTTNLKKKTDKDANNELKPEMNIPTGNHGPGLPVIATSGESADAISKAMSERGNGRKTSGLMYLGVGLWYGRACVNSQSVSDGTRLDPGAEWCTTYIRTNSSTLDKKGQLFELRIEGSIGIALNIVSLVLAGTLCCCHRRSGLRMAFAVATLFIAGAVMAVPVVHVILQHATMHSKIMRRRNWGHVFINTHAQHDLFDHWSVIVCGVASIISTISTFIFTVLACRGDTKPSNRYDLGKVELAENTGTRKLNLSMNGNGKVTLPPETKFIDEQDLKADIAHDNDSACVRPDSSAPSAKDGGDSFSIDSFEEAKEMTSFKDEIGNYVDIDDADRKSDTSEQC